MNSSSMSSRQTEKKNTCVLRRYYYGQFGAGEKPCQASLCVKVNAFELNGGAIFPLENFTIEPILFFAATILYRIIK